MKISSPYLLGNFFIFKFLKFRSSVLKISLLFLLALSMSNCQEEDVFNIENKTNSFNIEYAKNLFNNNPIKIKQNLSLLSESFE
jgi:hypothetical protein